jgi:hypothetical protein
MNGGYEVRAASALQTARETIEFIREHHANSAECVGYAWAAMAIILMDAGEPYPVSPWTNSRDRSAA